MKKQNKQPQDLRIDWKNEAEDEIIRLQEDIDTLELPEDMVLEIEKYINRFKDRVNDAINNFEVTAEIAAKDVDLDDFLSQNKYDGLKEDDANTMKDMLEMEGYFVMKAPSLSEQYKIEAFMEDMKTNPYQLTLVA